MIGSTLGPYRVLEKLGQGGMGEVYRARDTRLDRDVALKILPETVANDPERLARFEREAKTLATLNHPHIAQIHGFEQSDGVNVLVMELVGGEDLSARIAGGPLPLDEVIPIARQIAEALEAAHEHGIVHRDLKPANIKVRADGTVKVLDFGLARSAAPGGQARESPTMTSPANLTMRGVILGTAAYMSPEQARGKVVDKRSDIWSFGCVLYEMLTGRAPFPGDTVTDVLAAVVTRDPDWRALPPSTPLAIRKLLARCLQRDPKQRLHDAADIRIELDDRETLTMHPPAATRRVAVRTLGISVAAALVAAAAMWWVMRSPAQSLREPVRRFALSELDTLVVDPQQSIAVSPNGRTLAYRGVASDGIARVFIRAFDALQPTAIAGTEGAQLPFLSPDGDWIAFFAGNELRRVPVGGGAAQTIAASIGLPLGGTWMDDGSIVFVGDAGLQRVSSGGTLEMLRARDPAKAVDMSTPAALPGSNGVLLLVRQLTRWQLAVMSVRDKSLTTLVEDAGTPAWASTGHVLFEQRNSIVALPFDSARLQATGPTFPVLTGLSVQVGVQTRLFGVAPDGTLAYVPAAPSGGEASLVWLDRSGKETLVTQLDRVSDFPRLSPDGMHVAFRTPAPNCDIWVHDLTRGTTTRLTRNGDHHGVVWSGDGRSVITARATETSAEIIAVQADGSGTTTVIGKASSDNPVPTSWSSSALLVSERDPQTQLDVKAYPTSPGAPRAILSSPASEWSAAFSPDGRFIAFASDASGRSEIYLRPNGGEGAQIQVSSGGGSEPVWARDGSALFFRNGRDFLIASVATRPAISVGRPTVLFAADVPAGPMLLPNFDVAPDGRQFLVMKGRQWLEGQAIVVLNWFAEWKQLGSGARPR